MGEETVRYCPPPDCDYLYTATYDDVEVSEVGLLLTVI